MLIFLENKSQCKHGKRSTLNLFPWKLLQILIVNTLRLRQNGRHFADAIFKCIFLNENVWIPIKISLKFVSKGPINNIPALVQIIAWHRPGDKPLSEPMVVNLTTYICVTRPQWVKIWAVFYLWLSKISTNERRRYKCDIFSHWLRPV